MRPSLSPSHITAVLGPTNTGKTHLAVERLCGHVSGVMGFPLRLLAREVYDKVVAVKGAQNVGLITGEEKIIPKNARYFLCTTESMPMDRDVSFLGIDEAQMAADDERGHVFTERLLYARGRDETMILGSDVVRPLIQSLVPDASIISRPRFSTLSYTAPKKLSRLPKRSAIVCFSTEEVYAIAEMLRRQRGGAAVVMGALSPRTRNAQVDMYQSGEVDYLVATDAIGMGLNMDITHIAFANIVKFDGKRRRRLTLAEMGQIAGRAGRHQRDGSFSMLHLNDRDAGFEADEVVALEAHNYPALTHLSWRNPELNFTSIEELIASLEKRSPRLELRRTDETIDLAVLKRVAVEPLVIKRVGNTSMTRRLWSICQLPDYRKTGAEQHSRLVLKLFDNLSSGRQTIPVEWIGAEVARLDSGLGDIDTLAARISGIRTWTYIAHQPDWLENPTQWAARTRAIEDTLSDALHERLMQRFVDRRTSVLMRDMKLKDNLAVTVDNDGSVEVEGVAIGNLSGFTFTVDPLAKMSEKRMVMAAAERALSGEMKARAQVLVTSDASAVVLGFDGTDVPSIMWQGRVAATLKTGRSLVEPAVVLHEGAAQLATDIRAMVQSRLEQWLSAEIELKLKPLATLHQLARKSPSSDGISGAARGLIVQLIDSGGCMPRSALTDMIAGLIGDDRKLLREAGLKLGQVHVFCPALLKPETIRWRLALHNIYPSSAKQCPQDMLWSGRTSVRVTADMPADCFTVAGYWPVGAKALRVDMVERLADVLREPAKSRLPFVPPESAISLIGVTHDEFAEVMLSLGYRKRFIDVPAPRASAELEIESQVEPKVVIEKMVAYQWRGQQKPVKQTEPAVLEATPHTAFANLAGLLGRNGVAG